MNEFFRRIRYIFEALIAGDRPWGTIRLLFTILILAMGFFAFFVFFTPVENILIEAARAIYHFILDLFQRAPAPAPVTTYPPPPHGHIYPPPASNIVQLLREFVAIIVGHLRYLLAFAAAITLAFLVGGRYVQDIYELTSYRKSLRYVLTSAFGFPPYPRLVVEEGKAKTRMDEVNTLVEIGGPGIVTIRPGNLVLFEHLRGPSAVQSAGSHSMSRFETISVVVPLEEQDVTIPKAKATTKDGIEVEIKDIRFRFRLYPGKRYGGVTSRTLEEPYPYSPQAVKNYAYNRNVGENGVLNTWPRSVQTVVEGAITDYINIHTIDQLTAPGSSGQDPRGRIKQTIHAQKTRKRLKDLGAELIWCDIGHFEITDKRISAQRIETWQTRWVGQADIIRAKGEAQRLTYHEIGRAEGQAELLQSIMRSINELETNETETPSSRLNNLMLLRTAQILEAMTERYRISGIGPGGQGRSSQEPNLPGLPG